MKISHLSKNVVRFNVLWSTCFNIFNCCTTFIVRLEDIKLHATVLFLVRSEMTCGSQYKVTKSTFSIWTWSVCILGFHLFRPLSKTRCDLTCDLMYYDQHAWIFWIPVPHSKNCYLTYYDQQTYEYSTILWLNKSCTSLRGQCITYKFAFI